jgi:ElaB/YqjD/DUF883 family membrane-anchored ribosome-binding protein
MTHPEAKPAAGASITDLMTQMSSQTARLLNKTDVSGRAKAKVADTEDAIAERTADTKDAIVEKTHPAQTTARQAITDTSDSVKPSAPIAAVVAATAVVVAGVVASRRRR